MPLNESAGVRRSALTTQQKRQEEAAIYGLQPISPMQTSELTPQEIERMRTIVASHDRTQGKIEQFDLNNPPQANVRFTPFPRLIYNHGNRTHKLVQDEEQLQEHLAAGWDMRPYPMEAAPEPPRLDAAAAAEADEVNQQLALLRKRK